MKFRKFAGLGGIVLLTAVLSACNLGATPPPSEDTSAIQTQAFNLVLTQAALQQTQTAQALPPTPEPTDTPFTLVTDTPPPISPLGATNTPFAFNTQPPGFTPLALASPTPGVVNTITTRNGCNDGRYEGEGGIKDGETIEAGKAFTKSFMLHNTGDCTWDEGYSFAFVPEFSTPGFQGYSIVLPKNKPSEYTKPGYGQTFVLKLTAPKTPGTYKAYWKMKDDEGNFFGPLVWLEIIVK